jgi:hypothetical protein
MILNIPNAGMASAALAISQTLPKAALGTCCRCSRQGVAVATKTGMCQHCDTKAEARAQGLQPITPLDVKTYPGV